MSGVLHAPADAETVAWNQAREAEWLAGRAAARQAKDVLWAAANALEVMLRGLAPAVFHDPPVPLKIGTSDQLIALLEGEAEPETVRRFLRSWTSRSGYFQALARGGPRYDLDGHPAVGLHQRNSAFAGQTPSLMPCGERIRKHSRMRRAGDERRRRGP